MIYTARNSRAAWVTTNAVAVAVREECQRLGVTLPTLVFGDALGRVAKFGFEVSAERIHPAHRAAFLATVRREVGACVKAWQEAG